LRLSETFLLFLDFFPELLALALAAPFFFLGFSSGSSSLPPPSELLPPSEPASKSSSSSSSSSHSASSAGSDMIWPPAARKRAPGAYTMTAAAGRGAWEQTSRREGAIG
jgi:hypothetical protein